jgi:hypothetical protein
MNSGYLRRFGYYRQRVLHYRQGRICSLGKQLLKYDEDHHDHLASLTPNQTRPAGTPCTRSSYDNIIRELDKETHRQGTLLAAPSTSRVRHFGPAARADADSGTASTAETMLHDLSTRQMLAVPESEHKNMLRDFIYNKRLDNDALDFMTDVDDFVCTKPQDNLAAPSWFMQNRTVGRIAVGRGSREQRPCPPQREQAVC